MEMEGLINVKSDVQREIKLLAGAENTDGIYQARGSFSARYSMLLYNNFYSYIFLSVKHIIYILCTRLLCVCYQELLQIGVLSDIPKSIWF